MKAVLCLLGSGREALNPESPNQPRVKGRSEGPAVLGSSWESATTYDWAYNPTHS